MAERVTGGCACGRVRYTATIHDHDAYLCHCRMCQRATGSISIAFKNVKQAEVDWEHEPDWYDSSPIAERPYCRECGTSLGFRFKDGSEKMDLTVASFDDPSRFVPEASFRRREHAARLAQHRRAAGKADRRLSGAGRQVGRGDRARSPDERGPGSSLDRLGRGRAGLSRAGQGRPVVLLHGLFSDAQMNWIKFGHAERIAASGFRVIMPDLRAHGLSGRPHEPEHYPRGILARDLRELIAHLGLDRVRPWRLFARCADDGRRGRRGTATAARDPRRRRPGGPSPLGAAQAFLPRSDRAVRPVPARRSALAVDPVHEKPEGRSDRVAPAARKLRGRVHGLAEGLHDADPGGLRVEDDDNGSAEELAACCRTRCSEVPGTHMSSVTRPELGEAIAEFLSRIKKGRPKAPLYVAVEPLLRRRS